MSHKNKCRYLSKEAINKHSGKPSSFWMHYPEIIFNELNFNQGDTFLDLGCGVGDYSLYAAKIIGDSGIVYSLDRNETLIRGLEKKAEFQGLKNIKVKVADVTKPLPLDDNSIDVCLVATVLHALDSGAHKKVFYETSRVLKSSGRLFTIDCSKKDDSFGPPISMRLSPEEVEAFAVQFGFKITKKIDLGFNYMICFNIK